MANWATPWLTGLPLEVKEVYSLRRVGKRFEALPSCLSGVCLQDGRYRQDRAPFLNPFGALVIALANTTAYTFKPLPEYLGSGSRLIFRWGTHLYICRFFVLPSISGIFYVNKGGCQNLEAKLYSSNLCLGKSLTGHVVSCCSCHGLVSLFILLNKHKCDVVHGECR